MRNKQVLLCALVGALCVFLVGPSALAQATGALPPPSPINPPPDATPEQIAEFCITKATEIANRAVRGNKVTADRSVAIIEQLLEAGQEEDALCVARWAIFWVDRQSGRTVGDIERLCRRCVRAILEAGGSEELAEQVRTACHDQIKRVRESHDAAIEAIKAALPVPPEPEAAPEPEE